jgi:D-arabinose 1-dehydrogenase
VLQTTAQGPLKLPSIIFGAGPLSTLYNSEDYVAGADPFRTIRLALRYVLSSSDL